MRTRNDPAKALWPWATLIIASGLGFLGLSGSVALRYTLPLSLILLVFTYVEVRDKPSPRFIGKIFILTVGISGLDLLAHRAALSVYSIAVHARSIFLFFSIVLAFWCREWIWIEKYSKAWNARRAAVLILLISFALIGLRWMLGGPQSFTADENIYLFQSYHGSHDLRGMKIEPWLEPFLRVRQTYVRDGFLNGQYPPGWPFVLNLFHLIGLSSIAGSLICTASIIALTYWVRMLRGSWEVAAIAVCLAATPFAQLYFNTSYLSHGISTFFALTAAISALAASRSSGHQGVGLWFLAGSLVSVLATVRPLTGLTGAILLLGWLWISDRFRFSAIAASSLGLSLFGLPLLFFNWKTTGHPLQFGYELAQGGLQSPGFGLRGSIGFSPEGVAVADVWSFSALDGLLAFIELVAASVSTFWPGGLILVLLAISLDRREFNWRVSGTWILGCLSLPAAYALYAFSFPRLVVEGLPFAAAGSAIWAGSLLRRDHRMTRALVYATIVTGLVFSLGRFAHFQRIAQTRNLYVEMVKDLRDEYGPLLVFVRGPAGDSEQSNYEHGLEALFWFNAQPEQAVVVGRDVEQLRSRVRDHYPGHMPVLFRSGGEGLNGAWDPPEVQILLRSGSD